MVIEPIDYSASAGRAMLQGLAAGRAIQGIRQNYQQMEDEQAAKDAAQQFQADWQSSFGDPQKMTALAAKYPGQMEAIRSGIGFQNEQHQISLGNAARDLRVAMATGNPQAVQQAAMKHAGVLATVGSSADDITQQFQQNPGALANIVDAVGLSALGAKDYYGVENQRLQNETTRRGQDISAATARRGQDISAQNSLRSSGGSVPASVKEFQYFNSLSPEQQKTYLRVRGRPNAGGDNVVQLADGRTVTVGGKLHGSGASAFYEGTDDNGNMVRVPASSISATPSSAASAQNYAMKKDLDAISGSLPNDLDFMTGITGSSGSQAFLADIRSRAASADQRKLYNAAQRIQGRMQNQGIAAARDMGASGINTVAEAKMYFQGMPQVDYSSPEAMQQSVRDIQQYTDNYNQQYQVNVGGTGRKSTNQQPAEKQSSVGSFTSKSGIQFTVE